MADIADNTFIGTTAVKDRNGRWQATDIHISVAVIAETNGVKPPM